MHQTVKVLAGKAVNKRRSAIQKVGIKRARPIEINCVFGLPGEIQKARHLPIRKLLFCTIETVESRRPSAAKKRKVTANATGQHLLHTHDIYGCIDLPGNLFDLVGTKELSVRAGLFVVYSLEHEDLRQIDTVQTSGRVYSTDQSSEKSMAIADK